MNAKSIVSTVVVLGFLVSGVEAARAQTKKEEVEKNEKAESTLKSSDQTPNKPATAELTKTEEVKTPDEVEKAEATKNNRMRALEGAQSPWSLQAQLSYSGSTIQTPFDEFAPNPGGDNPPPVVKLSGLIQTRYRFDETRSFGAGAGITTETPFQKPTNTTVSDPTFDYAMSSNWGGAHNRVDLTATVYTNNYETKYLYAYGLTLADDLLYQVGESGLTFGLSSLIYGNAFRGETVDGVDVRAVQTDYGLGLYPLAEYQMTKKLNLRSVVGFQYEHVRDMAALSLREKRIYQTLGLGVSITENFFTYFFALFYPSPLNGIRNEETSVGFSAIINVF